jgi:A/G-specific adenine glycosylase
VGRIPVSHWFVTTLARKDSTNLGEPGESTQLLSSPWKQAFRRQLKRWFVRHRRDLPWRQNSNPYKVFVSEVMLQQTTVAMVEGYYNRFITEFPTVEDLAAASEQQVLRVWEGLGYYRRARSMQAAARMVVEEFGGQFPDTVEGLMRLPGIGRYTAGAIVSIAYDKPAPILEANTFRLLTRLTAYDGDPLRAAGQRWLWHVAEQILPRREVSPFNQSLMELGSLVCTPREPKCPECPVANLCEAHRRGRVKDLLPTTKKTVYTDLHEVAVVVTKGNKVLVRQCGPTERWSGLWDFPRFQVEGTSKFAPRDTARQSLRTAVGIEATDFTHVATLKHGVTRYRITLECFVASYADGSTLKGGETVLKWLPVSKLSELPLSTTGRKMAQLVAAGERATSESVGPKPGAARKKKAAPTTGLREGGGGTRSEAKC